MLFILESMANGFFDLFHFIITPSLWFDVTNMKWIAQLIFYGGSKEFLFIVIDLAVILLLIGLYRPQILWGFVHSVETVNNIIGRIAAWAALIMVVQQVIIVLLQRIFLVAHISIPPYLDIAFTRDVSWFSEELKLYNALIVTLCAGYTFIQGGHVRVDLIYSAVSSRSRKWIDAICSLILMLPFMSVLWLYAWYFMWRHLVIPKVSASDSLDMITRKANLMRWKIETTSFSPNGFDAYFLFKVLLVLFAGLMFLQGLAFFYRNILELREGKDFDQEEDRKDDVLLNTSDDMLSLERQ